MSTSVVVEIRSVRSQIDKSHEVIKVKEEGEYLSCTQCISFGNKMGLSNLVKQTWRYRRLDGVYEGR